MESGLGVDESFDPKASLAEVLILVLVESGLGVAALRADTRSGVRS